MIRSLTLDNYRGFRHFEMQNLGRVNLIVGTNNAGKTSVLEAVHILETPGELGPLWSILTRRGEDFDETESNRSVRHVDIRRVFHGHEIDIGNRVDLSAVTGAGVDRFIAIVRELNPELHEKQPRLFDTVDSNSPDDVTLRDSSLGLHWENASVGRETEANLDLTRRGAVSSDALRVLGRGADGTRIPIRFVTASSFSPETVIDLFEDVVLTPSEDFVIEALRIIEPSIERIATSGSERRRTLPSRMGTRGGLVVRCSGIKDRIPIGSMGDGIWRILGLALALVRTEGGILLVDEIDTGLHYSVMEGMWKLVSQTAKKHEIQVFATTHSRDCYESLAAISREAVAKNSDVTIQRIERGKERAVAYSEQEIIAASRRHLEVR